MDIQEVESLEKDPNRYTAFCWTAYDWANHLEPNNEFVQSVGKYLYKNRKLTPKQLYHLFNLLDKKSGKFADNGKLPWD